MTSLLRIAARLALLCLPAALAAEATQDARTAQAALIRAAVETLCPLPELSGAAAQALVPGAWLLSAEVWPDPEAPARVSVRLAVGGGDELHVERRQAGGQVRQMRVAYHADTGDVPAPRLLAIADGGCTIRSARALRADGPVWRFLDQLEGDMATLRWTETLQAPWPEGRDRGGVAVGLVDSGLAYDLPLFRDRLARGPDGAPLGYDYWDLDPWPYDGDTSRGAFLPIRHGTAVASILAREAPDAALAPFRYPRPDMTRLGALVDRAAEGGIRVLAMPLGSRDPADWTAFAAALERHGLLAIVSAGNDGRDIDAAPVYPAALASEHILTVTSADAFGRLAPGSNWGARHVDLMAPAENQPVIDFRGAEGVASGSSYAVPRIAAMAARLLAQEPGLTALELRARLLAAAVPSPFEREGLLAAGWIADPLAFP